jgi:hypothetical protein
MTETKPKSLSEKVEEFVFQKMELASKIQLIIVEILALNQEPISFADLLIYINKNKFNDGRDMYLSDKVDEKTLYASVGQLALSQVISFTKNANGIDCINSIKL